MSKARNLDKMMTIADMAQVILDRNKQPLHYKEIFEEINQVKQVKNSSSVQSCIYSHNLFIRMGDGYWGLRKWLLDGLKFVYSINPLEYERNVFQIDYDHELYFPHYISQNKIKFKIEKQKYDCPYKNKQTFTAKEFYQKEEIDPGDKIIIQILDVNKLEYEIINKKRADFQLNLTKENEQIRELAFEVLREKRGIMSSSRLLEQILIKNFKPEHIEGEIDLGPFLPLSKILNNDSRFKEKLSGMFCLDS